MTKKLNTGEIIPANSIKAIPIGTIFTHDEKNYWLVISKKQARLIIGQSLIGIVRNIAFDGDILIPTQEEIDDLKVKLL